MKVDLYDLENKKVESIDVPDAIFGAKWNATLVKQVLLAQVANRRRPWAHAKDRSEVRGGGRKPWRQKGTGRARHGSTRSPLWIGGGKAHGPLSTRDYSQKVNKKMKQGALFAALSKKIKDGEVKFFETLEIEAPKAKVLSNALARIAPLEKKSKKRDLLLVPSNGKNTRQASGAFTKLRVVSPKSLNLYDVLNHKDIFIDREAVSAMKAHYTKLA